MKQGVVYWEHELEELLRPALYRIRQQQYINYLTYGLTCGLLLSALFLILPHFYLWSGAVNYALGAVGLAMLFSLLLARYFRPGIWQAASAVDTAGLKERVTTALEFSGVPIDMAVRQRQDAIKHLRTFDCEAKLPLQFSLRKGQIIGGLLVSVIFLTFWPNSHQAELANQIANKKEIIRQEKKIARVTKELQHNNKELPAAQREKAIQDLQLLQKNLNHSGNLSEALKALSQAEEKLSEAPKTPASMSEQEMVSLLAALRTQASTRHLADKIASGDTKASQAEIANLMKTSSQPNGGEGAQPLTRALAKAAASASSSRAAQALQTMSGTANGAGVRSSSGNQDMNQQVAGWSAQAGVFNDVNQALAAIQDARGAMLASNNAANSQLASAGGPAASPGSGKNAGPSNGDASGSGKGGNGAGQQGQGAETSSGNGGFGAGRGSSNGNSPPSSKGSPNNMAGGLGSSEMNVGEYEKIYAPERIGQAGESSYVKGEAGNGPQQMVDTDDPLTNSGSMRPYGEIIGHYSQAARDSLERSSIPAGKSEMVKKYFLSLED